MTITARETAKNTTTARSVGPTMIWSDAKILWQLAAARVRGETHAERLENFYASQKHDYDGFRDRLLHGRRELFESIEPPDQAVWIDFGAGTGVNAEHLSQRLNGLSMVYLVDLCPSLLSVAEERITRRGWKNVWAVCADATSFSPPEGYADVVTFSYSLTMIPDWYRAIDHAFSLLKPGGLIGVVDFYVARKYPGEGKRRHDWATRTFWPIWFAFDNVHLSADHLPMLEDHFDTISTVEQMSRVPYLPFVRAPYFRYVGRKRPISD